MDIVRPTTRAPTGSSIVIPRAVRVPSAWSLFDRLRTVRLIADGAGLTVLELGNAMRVGASGEVVAVGGTVGAAIAARTVIPRMAQKMEAAVQAAEQRLATMTVAEFLASSPRSRHVPRAAITRLEHRVVRDHARRQDVACLTVHYHGGKLRLEQRLPAEAELATVAAMLQG